MAKNPHVDFWEQKLDAYERRNRLRVSRSRKLVLETIVSIDRPFTKKELAEKMRLVGAGLARSTVYYAIHVLIEAGILGECDGGTAEPPFYQLVANSGR